MISFDLDMTLLDHRTDQITPSALEAIEKLRPKYKIVLATGRDMDNYYSTSYRDIVRPDAIVHMNGTKITVGDKLLFEHIFDPKLLHRVLSFCDEKGFGIGMTVGDEDYYIHPEIIAANDIRFWGSCGRQFQDPWKMLTMPVRTLAFVGSREQVKEMEREFPTLKLPMFASGCGRERQFQGGRTPQAGGVFWRKRRSLRYSGIWRQHE